MQFRLDEGCGCAARLVACVALTLLVLQPRVLAAQTEPVATVGQVVGTAFAERDGVRRQLGPGEPVAVADLIVTETAAKIEIAFSDGSKVSAGPNTRFAIAKYDPARNGRGLLQLLAGIIRTNLSAVWGGGFAVETRAVIASVRSTHWVTIVEGERSSVFIVDGEVVVQAVATREEVVLSKGLGVDVQTGGGLPQPRRWPIERVGRTMGPTLLP